MAIIVRCVCALFVFLLLSAHPVVSDTILQAFWWDCQNESSYAPGRTYKYEWYNYIRAQLPRLEEIGITALWTPPPTKSANSTGESMGYDVFDHYDLGEKPQNQPPSKPDGRTRFGTRDELLRLVSAAHAHGIRVYPDIVLNHMSGGQESPGAPVADAAGHKTGNRWKKFRYPSAGGPDLGRWPKDWWNFHPNPDHNSVNSNDIDVEIWGPDICYASNRDAAGSPSPGYMLRQAADWFEWLSRLTGVDGYRFDAVRHYESRVVRDLLAREEASRGRKPFAVAEYGAQNSDELDRWIQEVDGRSCTFDFPLREQLYSMVRARGLYNLGTLPDFLQKQAKYSVTFVNSHDTVRGPAGNAPSIPPDDPWGRLAYAFILSLDRTPCVFYEDLFPNISVQERRYGDPSKRPMRWWLADLIKIREHYGVGPEPVRYPLRSEDLLVIERPGKMVAILNDNGVDWKQASFTTSFGSGVELKDITGQFDNLIVTGRGTDAGKVSLWLPPVSYVILVKASESRLLPLSRKSWRTVQEIEFADDLATGSLNSAGRRFRVWPAARTEVFAELRFADSAAADIELVGPNGKRCRAVRPFDGHRGSWRIAEGGWHEFRIRVRGQKSVRAFLKVDYEGQK